MTVLDDSQLKPIDFSPICSVCVNLESVEKRRCKAFKSIPLQIWNGDNNHTKSFPGDKGIRLEIKKEN